MTQQESIARVLEVLNKECENPAEKIIEEARVLSEIGKALKGFSTSEARGIMQIVSTLIDNQRP